MVARAGAEQRLSRDETCIVRFLAIVLITNSHLDHLYPWPQLGTGGAIGNALFFMLSGYGLVVSEQGMRRSFPSWYWRRITRIYPSGMLVTAMDMALNRSWLHWRVMDYVSAFLWPTLFWFVGAIMIFYLLFFTVMRLGKGRFFLAGIALLCAPYLYWYFSFVDLSAYTIEGASHFKWIFYLQVMFFGGYLADSVRIPKGTVKHLLYLCAALLGYMGIIIAVRAGFGMVQSLIHVITFPITYLVLSLSKSPFVTQRILKQKAASFLVSLMAGVTLEIYMVQYMVYSNRFVIALPFPVNIIVFWVIVVLLASIVESVASFSRKILRREQRTASPAY